MSILKTFFVILFFCSCAQFSGYYAKINTPMSWEEIANKYNVSIKTLKIVNHNELPEVGKWVFIPKRIGFVARDPDLEKGKDILSFKDMKRRGSKDEYLPGAAVNPNLDLIWPVPSHKVVSSYFGPRKGRFHDGLDIPAPRGTSIQASGNGEVIYASSKIRGYGKMVVIAHGGDYFTTYAHLSKFLVSQGDQVKAGEKIALVGNTGHSSGPHLHYEVRLGKQALDPMDFVNPERDSVATNQ